MKGMGLKVFLILFISNLSFAAQEDLYICSGDLKGKLPEVDSNTKSIYEKLKNRTYDPCDLKVDVPQSKEQICNLSAKDFQSLLCEKSGMMGFDNNGGLFGLQTGVCWWHSQFHRFATYQAYYNPKAKKPNPDTPEGKKQIKKIFNDIIRKRGPVEVPGYSNLYEFTKDPKIEKLLQRRLQGWMAEDSFLKMQWYKGIFVPDNYSKKSPDSYNKDRDKFMYPPMGEKYRQDMYLLAEMQLDEVDGISDKFKKEELESMKIKIDKRLEESKEAFIKRISEHLVSTGKTQKEIDEHIKKSVQKAESAYDRLTYDSKEKELKKKDKTLKHQNKEIIDLFDQVNNDKKISYVTIQNAGIGAHSQIVFDAKKFIDEDTGKESYVFKVMDSNHEDKMHTEGFGKKPYSLMKFVDGRWYIDASGGGNNFNFMNANIKVHHKGQIKAINRLFQKHCGKSLF